MTPKQKIAPCLWFDGRAEEATRFYVSLFPNSRVDEVSRCDFDWPGGKAGDVIVVAFTLDGRSYRGLNGGPSVEFNDSVSLSVNRLPMSPLALSNRKMERIWCDS